MVEGRNKNEVKTHRRGPICEMLVCRVLHLTIRSQQKRRSIIMITTQLDLLNRFNESDTPENASGETTERQIAKKMDDNLHVKRGNAPFQSQARPRGCGGCGLA
jgi:hypothetical protein